MNLKLTSVYLTAKGGYTASKANDTANVIKQICESIDSRLNNHVLIDQKLDKNGVEMDYVQTTPALSVEQVVELATKEGKYYAVSAWLREGIKAKDALLNQVRYATPDALGIQMPNLQTYVGDLTPSSSVHVPSEDETDLVVDRLSVADRAEYLSLEAQAAHIGKRIHSKLGLFHKWRNKAVAFKPMEFLTPNTTQVFIITNTLRLSVEQIDEILLRLQGEHRAVESKLNGYKARLKTMVQELIQEAQAKRALLDVAYKAAYENFASDQKIALATAESKRSELLLTVSKLGIIIPKEHDAILKEVAAKTAKPGNEATETEVG